MDRAVSADVGHSTRSRERLPAGSMTRGVSVKPGTVCICCTHGVMSNYLSWPNQVMSSKPRMVYRNNGVFLLYGVQVELSYWSSYPEYNHHYTNLHPTITKIRSLVQLPTKIWDDSWSLSSIFWWVGSMRRRVLSAEHNVLQGWQYTNRPPITQAY